MEKINLYADQREEKSKGKALACVLKNVPEANDYVRLYGYLGRREAQECRNGEWKKAE